MTVGSQTDPIQNIGKILEIIDYKDDKEKSATELLNLCEKQALADLVKGLPEEKRSSLNGELSNNEDVKSVLNNYFPNDQIANAIKAASEFVMKQYLEEIIPTLSEKQLASLETLFTPQSDNNTVQK